VGSAGVQLTKFPDFLANRFSSTRRPLPCHNEQIMVRRQVRAASWKNSEAKRLLVEDLKAGRIPLCSSDMPAQDVYLFRVEFTCFPFEAFRSNLHRLRKKYSEQQENAEEEDVALAHDRALFPKKLQNERGEARWEGSDAERLLRVDIDNGLHMEMSPMELWKSRREYKDNFTNKVFRKHIYQEVRSRKYRAYIKSKAR
jgi:hypothetical protein